MLVVLGLIGPAATAHAAETYYVRAGGSGDCLTPATPCDSVATAVDLANADTDEDTIDIGPGTFAAGVFPSQPAIFDGAGAAQTRLEGTDGLDGFAAITFSKGGAARGLTAIGGDAVEPDPGAGRPGLWYTPVNDEIPLLVEDVVATGGVGSVGAGGTREPAPGLRVSALGTQDPLEVTVSGSSLTAGTGVNAGANGLLVARDNVTLAVDESTVTASGDNDALIHQNAGSELTVTDSVIKGQFGIGFGGNEATVDRSRFETLGTAFYVEPNGTAEVRNSLLHTKPNALSPYPAASFDGATTAVIVGSTIVDQSGGSAAVRAANGATAVLRNTAVRSAGASIEGSVTTETSAIDDPVLNANFTLPAGSPLIDAGNPAFLEAGDLDLTQAARSLDGNNDGTARTDIGAFEHVFRPPAPPGGKGAPPNVPPAVSGFSLTNTRFATKRKRGSKRKRGTTFRFSLSEDASVRIVIHQRLKGVRKKGRCRKRKKGEKGRSCTRFVSKRTVRAAGKAGRNSVKYSGRGLKPGRYRATLTATDAGRLSSNVARVTFRVVSP